MAGTLMPTAQFHASQTAKELFRANSNHMVFSARTREHHRAHR
ncbi:hypothetical protein Q604_UNBC09974G0001, partial [human gut metagenome]